MDPELNSIGSKAIDRKRSVKGLEQPYIGAKLSKLRTWGKIRKSWPKLSLPIIQNFNKRKEEN